MMKNKQVVVVSTLVRWCSDGVDYGLKMVLVVIVLQERGGQ